MGSESLGLAYPHTLEPKQAFLRFYTFTYQSAFGMPGSLSLNCLTLYPVSVLLWDHHLPRASSRTLKVYPRVKGTLKGDRLDVFSE